VRREVFRSVWIKRGFSASRWRLARHVIDSHPRDRFSCVWYPASVDPLRGRPRRTSDLTGVLSHGTSGSFSHRGAADGTCTRAGPFEELASGEPATISFPKSALVAAATLGVITLEESSGRQQLPRPQPVPEVTICFQASATRIHREVPAGQGSYVCTASAFFGPPFFSL